MDNNLNNLQRVEAGRRLEILGYEKDVCEKYLDEEFALKLQEADSNEVPEEEDKGQTLQKQGKVTFSRKLKWLNTMLWGGAALLAFEHVWHGEVVPYLL